MITLVPYSKLSLDASRGIATIFNIDLKLFGFRAHQAHTILHFR